MKFIYLLLVLSAITNACAPIVMRSDSATCDDGNTVFISEVEILLCYYNGLSSMSDNALTQEHQSVQQRQKNFSYDRDQIRLAILLSIPNTDFANSERALSLIKKTQQSRTSNPSVRHLLSVLNTLISRQIELNHARGAHPEATDISTLKARMKDYNLRQKVEALEKALLGEKARADELNATIEALRKVDSSIDARP